MRRPRTVLAVAVTGLLLTGCAGQSDDEPLGAGASAAPAATETPAASPEPTAAPEAVDPASVGANELGKVPVMMYHQIKPDPKGEYDQTPEAFKAELKRMYDLDFRPVNVRDLVAGKIDIPAGKRAFAMTFDDSPINQAQIGADGAPTPDSALGILEAFGEEYPDFNPTATFYVNASPFNDTKVLPWLAANGYDVGVHTRHHTNLRNASESGVQEAIGGNAADIEAATGVKPTTISLPFGIGPTNKALLRAGTWEGGSYTLEGAMLVGSHPAPSPFAETFDPYAVPRIRSGDKDNPVIQDSVFWLDSMEKNLGSVFVSDGDPDKISFPADSTVKIGSAWADKANPYTPAGTSAEPAATPAATESSTGTATETAATETAAPGSTAGATPAPTP